MQLSYLEKRFREYIDRFVLNSGQLPPPLALKAEHCHRVADEAKGMSSELHWPAHEQDLARAAGLLHDIGRFSQFAEFSTFSDVASVDHGQRGAAVLQRAGWFSDWSTEDSSMILVAVRYHNRLRIPASVRDRPLALLRLVRDADKLDIQRIVLEAIERDGFRDLPAMLPQIRLDGPVSPQVIDQLSCEKCASLDNVKSLADFLLMQLSWVYNLNYPPAFRRFQSRGIDQQIMNLVDGSPRIHALQEKINHFVLHRATAPAPSTGEAV